MKVLTTKKEMAEFIVETGSCEDGISSCFSSDTDQTIDCPLCYGYFDCAKFKTERDAAKAYLASLDDNGQETHSTEKQIIGTEDKIIELLDTLSDEQKLEVFANYCTECGCKNQHCNCSDYE